ncbi:MAG: DUF1501 domain-containing protein [Candidatus Eremiobacteraeota bacterium]|nr:DUF1501 domain-containing protein [Candidatus Eremiobacteraeota bacterium]
MKRSRFVFGALAGLTVTAGADSLFGAALAQPVLPQQTGDAADRVLVVINLQGGNDGLNMVVPHGMPQYYRYRPSLGIAPKDVLHIDGVVGLNPQMTSLKSMFDAGNVAIVQGAGYPKPDHSHFRSTEIWQTAAPERYESTGWVGRYLDSAELPKENLFNAVALAPVLPELMLARRVDVPAIAGLRGYGLTSDRNAPQRSAFSSLLHDDRVPFASPYLATVATIEDHAQRGSQELPKLLAGYTTTAAYPATAIGRSLALAAQIAGSRLGTRVIYLQHGSFDTHAAQRPTQDRLLRELSDGLKAFYDDLAAHGNEKRVLTLTFSEFGRRVGENASRGTDHGEAAPMLLVGGRVKGGLYGAHPSLDELDNGDMRYTLDFRSVYATVLEKWFARSPSEILAGTFPTLRLLA